MLMLLLPIDVALSKLRAMPVELRVALNITQPIRAVVVLLCCCAVFAESVSGFQSSALGTVRPGSVERDRDPMSSENIILSTTHVTPRARFVEHSGSVVVVRVVFTNGQ